jgi:hypothetical protein
VTEYWRARLDWNSALEIAQKYRIADSASFPSVENENRFGLVDTWREAVVKQLLTPAPDGAAVAWKRAQLAGRGFSHLPTKAERIERVIAEDLAFLAAHPTRRAKAGALKSEVSSGSEFAAVVATMPEADQQEIRATVREILQEREQ